MGSTERPYPRASSEFFGLFISGPGNLYTRRKVSDSKAGLIARNRLKLAWRREVDAFTRHHRRVTVKSIAYKGDLRVLRHIIVNDDKSASYKPGLVRTLLRVAEGAPGMVLIRPGFL